MLQLQKRAPLALIVAILAMTGVANANSQFPVKAKLTANGQTVIDTHDWKPGHYLKKRLTPGVIRIPALEDEDPTISGLKRLRATVSVGLDPTWRIVEATLEGGADGIAATPLKIRDPKSGSIIKGLRRFAIQLPKHLYPSASVPYSIQLVAKNRLGRQVEASFPFRYKPALASVKYAKEGVITLPYLGRSIDDALVIENPDVTNARGVFVQSDKESTAPVRINGVLIEPGDRQRVGDAVLKQGNISLPMAIDADGEAILAIDFGSRKGDVAMIEVDSASPRVMVSPSSASPSLMDDFSVTAFADGCQLSASSRKLSTEELLSGDAPCKIEWIAPAGLEASDENRTLTGQIVSGAPFELSYLVTYETEKGPVHVHNGSINVSPVQVQAPLIRQANPAESVIRVDGFELLAAEDSDRCDGIEVYTPTQGLTPGTCVVELVDSPVALKPRPVEGGEVSYVGILRSLGENEFVFRTGQISKSGEPVWFTDRYTAKVLGIDPVAPKVEIMGDISVHQHVTGQPLYKVEIPLNPRPVKALDIAPGSPYPVEVLLSVPDMGIKKSYTLEPGQNPISIFAEDLDIWEFASVEVTSRYVHYPQKKSVQRVGIIQLPSSTVSMSLSGSKEAYDLNPYNLEVEFGSITSTGRAFNPSTMGDWRISYGIEREGRFHELEQGGAIASSLISHSISPQDMAPFIDAGEVRVRAELKTPEQFEFFRTERYASLPAPVIKELKPVQATVTPVSASGFAPHTVTFNATLDRDTSSQFGGIQWQTQRNGSWEDIPGANDLSYTATYNVGEQNIRAQITNKFAVTNGIALSTTSAHKISTHPEYEVSLYGSDYVFSGDEIELRAEAKATANGEPLDDMDVTWSYKSLETGELITGYGETFHFSESRNGRYRITAVAKPKSLSGDIFPGVTSQTEVTVGSPSQLVINFSGPYAAEVGRENKFNADVYGPWRQGEHKYELYQKWTLPDGTVVEDPSLVYKPTEDILIDGGNTESYIKLWHVAYVKGFEEETRKESYRQVRVWKYEWPEFDLKFRSRFTHVPTNVTIEFVPTDGTWYRRTYGDPIKYEYSLPDGVEMVEEKGARIVVRVTEPGEKVFSAKASDHIGNEIDGEETFVLAETPPMDVRFTATSTNEYFRVPFDMAARASISGGHYDDEVTGITWLLNGNQLEEYSGQQYPRIPVLTPGIHNLSVTVDSMLGTRVTKSIEFEGYENKSPVCTVTYTKDRYDIKAHANCADEDGRLAYYQWFVDGVETNVHSYRVSFRKPAAGVVVELKLVATDDSGATAEVTTLID